jgi:hypothetical protein
MWEPVIIEVVDVPVVDRVHLVSSKVCLWYEPAEVVFYSSNS